jgi:hypothetical protein
MGYYNMKDQLFAAGRKNIRVFDLNHDLRDMASDGILATDPIHPERAALNKIVDGRTRAATNLTERPGQKVTTNNPGRQEGSAGLSAMSIISGAATMAPEITEVAAGRPWRSLRL